jgi:hypothetical protein
VGIGKHMRGLGPRRRVDARGQSMMIVAFAFVGIIGFVGFAIDTGVLYLHRIWLGQAVDAASLAAGYELPNVRAACVRAVEYLRTNGYEASPDFSFEIFFPSQPDAPGGDPGEFRIDSTADGIQSPSDCTSPDLIIPVQHEDVHYQVGVNARQTVPVAFMSLLGFDTVEVGTPGTAERSDTFDVALVLDKSGSMKFDSCSLFRPEDEYACQNRYEPCTTFFQDDFDAYSSEADLEAAGWAINEQVTLHASGGHSGVQSVEIRAGGGVEGFLHRSVDGTGWGDISLFFWARDLDMSSADLLQVVWRPNVDVGWNQIMEVTGAELASTWTQYAVLLPGAADDIPDMQLGLRVSGSLGRGLQVDDIQVKSCPQVQGPWIWYKWDWYEGCRLDRPMTCASDDPATLLPGASIGTNDPPMAQLLQQPMLDVLQASEDFMGILDSRLLPGQAREDQVGLATFDQGAYLLHDLTLDYEALQTTMYTSIEAEGGTNIGDGMRTGLAILGDGRPSSSHFMVLLTDGWPNYYDYPYSSPTSFGYACSTDEPCPQTLAYIDAQIERARNQNVAIFTIGLGEDLDTVTFDASSVYGAGTEYYTGMDLLRRISEGTGGQAYHAPTSEELQQIFEWIARAIFVRLTQ